MKFLILALTIVFCVKTFALKVDSALESYKDNENYLNAVNEIKLFKVKEDKVFGNILPTLELNSNFTKQPSTNNSFVGTEQRQTFLSLRQPLFRGFSEFNALEYAQKLSETKKLAKEVVKRELQLQIADVFMQAYGLQKEISLFKELVKTNNNNFKLVKERQKIGKLLSY
jgi:outer membrane protein TolC